MNHIEKLLEGKYNYLKDDHIYSEEHFKVLREDIPRGNYVFQSEVLTRLETGEFLKVLINYELTHQFEPVDVKVTRILGLKESVEHYRINRHERIIDYTFIGLTTQHSESRSFGAKVHFVTPCFATSMVMTLIKKLDPVHKTDYSLVSSTNIWEFVNSFQEQEIQVELQKQKNVEIEINGAKLNATHCKLHQISDQGSKSEEGIDFYLSRHLSIPYLAILGDGIRIEIEKLKNFQQGS